MSRTSSIRRVVLVVLDGLRADAVPSLDLRCFRRLADAGASTLSGSTVSPSVTAAAMASLFTGVPPAHHGLRSDRFHVPRPSAPIHPVPRLLAEQGLPTSAFMAELPRVFRGVGRRIARQLGVDHPCFVGNTSSEILVAARATLQRQRNGLIFLHWPDCDRAGHATGWMSDDYVRAARRVDDSLGVLSTLAEVDHGSDTLLVALADHGGGGEDPRNHESAHPFDRTIPIVLTGGGASGSLGSPTLLDVSATLLWALGAPRPASYVGRPLHEAFDRATAAVA